MNWYAQRRMSDVQPKEEGEVLTAYVFGHYSRFFTRVESLALRSVLAEAKAHAYGGASAKDLRERYVSSDPEVVALLAGGVAAFKIRVRDRLLTEHSDQIHLNRCPRCSALARTPTACLCPACNHTWYELRKK